jgi:NTP pyrophosphatase (non-canonical NTP hydrolase)
MSVDELAAEIKKFCDDREWGQFHNPKDLSIAITLEASELLQHFLWQNGEQVRKRAVDRRVAITHEIADIAIYLIELANIMGIDLSEAIHEKLRINDQQYPVERSRGTSRKYNEASE